MRSAFSFTFILLGSNQRWLILNSPFAAKSRKPDPCCTFSRREMRLFRPQGNTVQCRKATCMLIQVVFLIFYTKLSSSPAGGAKKKASRKTCFFLSNPKDWYGITARSAVHGIRRFATVWHHAQRASFLRIDSIHHFVMIPSRPSVWFHTRLRRDLFRSARDKLTTLCFCDIIFSRKAVVVWKNSKLLTIKNPVQCGLQMVANSLLLKTNI